MGSVVPRRGFIPEAAHSSRDRMIPGTGAATPTSSANRTEVSVSRNPIPPDVVRHGAVVSSRSNDQVRRVVEAEASMPSANEVEVGASRNAVVVRDGVVVCVRDSHELLVLRGNPSLMFRAVLLAVEHGVPIAPKLEQAIHQLASRCALLSESAHGMERIHVALDESSKPRNYVLAILQHPSWIRGLDYLERLGLLQLFLPEVGLMRSTKPELQSNIRYSNLWEATLAMAKKLPAEADLPTRLAILFSLTALVYRGDHRPDDAKRPSRKGVFYESRYVADAALERLHCRPEDRARNLALIRIMPTLRYIAKDRERMSVHVVSADFGPDARQIERALWVVDAVAEIGECPEKTVVKSVLLEARRIAANENARRQLGSNMHRPVHDDHRAAHTA